MGYMNSNTLGVPTAGAEEDDGEGLVDIDFDITCSYLEIYQENIFDLLDQSENKIAIREEKDKGVYADPCTREKVQTIG
jgi:hypothetical protein